MSVPTQSALLPLAAMRWRRVLHGVCCWMLTLACAALPAQDYDESDSRAAASHRFGLALQASKAAREPLPRFLERWLAATPAQEIALLSDAQRPWTGGGDQPWLDRAFVSDSTFESRLDEVLPALETLLQRVPTLAREAPWQSLLARAQLKAGQLQLALASARRAWALDARLCASDCAPLLRTWLRSGQVPPPTQWPTLPKPQASVDGVALVLPDRYCVDADCSATQAVDAPWVARRLQALLR